ncbi:hypothetical protein C2I18_28715 [Paenibacillus sp. PK3_47]|uniref:hypothetical protein n=1 Tax=Paenibacillus sp. PK3_47 TaxID=2072642 RepID=UPI00201D374C|nr:hypothetical protein [Paenibacillus sp. PK3_47]UQZ37170.1 hypothetical protein C2I18_28715 [Paenibacillus sp. PK3_47]
MKYIGYAVMLLGFLVWFAGIGLQARHFGETEKLVILAGQLTVVAGGIAQMIIKRIFSKRSK